MKKQFTKLIRCCSALVFFFAIGLGTAFAQPCEPVITFPTAGNEFISGVSYQAFTNTSVQDEYTNYSSLGTIGNISAGIPASIDVTVGSPFSSDNIYVFLDLNGDGDFTTNELIGSAVGVISGSVSTATVDLDVPFTAEPGDQLLRVKLIFAGGATATDPCADYGFGENEDYLVTVTEADCTPPNFNFTAVTDCFDETYEIRADYGSFGGNTSIALQFSSDNPDSEVNLDEQSLISFFSENTTDNLVIENIPFGEVITVSILVGLDSPCNSTVTLAEGTCFPADVACTGLTSGGMNEEISNVLPPVNSIITVAGVPAGQVVSDLNVAIAINHTFLGDLDISLIAPSGLIVPLQFDQCSGNDNMNVVYDDEGDAFACNQGPAEATLLGTFAPPSGELASFIGQVPNGDWILNIVDDAGGDVGTLLSWCLIPTYAEQNCEVPEITVAKIDTLTGLSIADCVTIGQGFNVEVTIGAADGNTSFEITATTATGAQQIDTILGGATTSFGPYSPGAVIQVAAVGIEDFLCGANATADGVVCPPVNDECAEAIEVECGTTYAGTTIGGLPYQAGIQFCAPTTGTPTAGAGGIWYTYTPDVLTQVTLATTGLSSTGFNVSYRRYIYSGSCDGLICVAGAAPFGNATTTFLAEGGVTYYILLGESFSTDITLSLNLSTCLVLDCELADFDVTPVDANGDEFPEGCIDFGTEVFAQVSLDGGAGNNSFRIRRGTSPTSITTTIDTLVAGETAIYGPFAVGSLTYFSATGIDDALCVSTDILTTTPCPPANDECSEAITADCNTSYTGSTIGAIDYEAGLEFCSSTGTPGAGSGGVWYTFTTPDVTEVTIATTALSLTGFNTSSRRYIYSGSCGDLTCVSGASLFGNATTTITTEANTTYYVLFGESFGAVVNYTLDISCVIPSCVPALSAMPVADENGTALDGCVPFQTDYYIDVTVSGGALNTAYDVSVNGGTVTTVPVDGSAILGPIAGGTAAVVSAFGTTNALCNADTTLSPEICVPDNDLCENAIALTCGQTVFGNTTIATPSVTTCDFGVGTTGAVWYSYTAVTDGTVVLETCNPGTDFDTDSHVFTGSCDDLTCFSGYGGSGYVDGASGCEFEGFATGGSFPAEAGETYYIMIDGFGTAEGNFELSLTCPPPPANDQPCGAIALLNNGTPSAPVNNITATTDEGEPVPAKGTCSGTAETPEWCDGPFGDENASLDNSIWYTFVGPATGRVSIDGCNDGSNFNNQFAVYSATDCNDYSTFGLLAANDNRPFGLFGSCEESTTFGLAAVEVCVTPGETYYLQVDGSNGATGNTVVSVSAVNGDICDCVLPDIFVQTTPECSDSTYNATVTINDFGSSTSFTYAYTNAGVTDSLFNVTDEVLITGLVLGSSTVFTVIVSDPACAPFGNLTATVTQSGDACDADCLGIIGGTSLPGTACTTGDDEPGIFNDDCNCQPTPENDLCENATEIFCGDTLSGSTVAASLTEDFCDFSSASGAVWFVYNATANGTVTIETCLAGTDFDTDSHVFTGSCDDLECYSGYGGSGYVDGASGCSFAGFATGGDFDVVEGETYYIMIDGFGTSDGNFSLSLTCELDDEVSLAGSVTGFTGTCDGGNVNVKLYTPGTAMLVAEYNTTIDASGNFTATDLLTGTYDVIVKVDRHLAKGFQDVVIAGGVNALAVGAVQNGDANNSNGINVRDLTFISGAYNTLEGNAGYNANADLNCSGGVNIQDLTIVSGAFNLSGAVAPLN